MSTLKKKGFVQTSTHPLPETDMPFAVRVTIPMTFADGVPFYLYIVDETGHFEMLVSDEDAVDELVREMAVFPDDPEASAPLSMYCWAWVEDDGEVNFDTKTECTDCNW